jgi:hypothetical protein
MADSVSFRALDGVGVWQDVTLTGGNLEVIDAQEGEMHVRDHSLGAGLISLLFGAGAGMWLDTSGEAVLPIVTRG